MLLEKIWVIRRGELTERYGDPLLMEGRAVMNVVFTEESKQFGFGHVKLGVPVGPSIEMGVCKV